MFCTCRALLLWFLSVSFKVKGRNNVLFLELLANTSQPLATFESDLSGEEINIHLQLLTFDKLEALTM